MKKIIKMLSILLLLPMAGASYATISTVVFPDPGVSAKGVLGRCSGQPVNGQPFQATVLGPALIFQSVCSPLTVTQTDGLVLSTDVAADMANNSSCAGKTSTSAEYMYKPGSLQFMGCV